MIEDSVTNNVTATAERMLRLLDSECDLMARDGVPAVEIDATSMAVCSQIAGRVLGTQVKHGTQRARREKAIDAAVELFARQIRDVARLLAGVEGG